jgi:hypothetical protein
MPTQPTLMYLSWLNLTSLISSRGGSIAVAKGDDQKKRLLCQGRGRNTLPTVPPLLTPGLNVRMSLANELWISKFDFLFSLHVSNLDKTRSPVVLRWLWEIVRTDGCVRWGRREGSK